MDIKDALEWADNRMICASIDASSTTEAVKTLAAEVRRLQEEKQAEIDFVNTATGGFVTCCNEVTHKIKDGVCLYCRAESAEAKLKQLGRESCYAVQGWWPEDFTDTEGPFTVDRAVEAIKAEVQAGRSSHQRLQISEAKLARAEEVIAAGNCHCTTNYECQRCKTLRDYEEEV